MIKITKDKSSYIEGGFQKKLEHSALKFIFLLSALSCLLFALALFISDRASKEINALRKLENLEEVYTKVYDRAQDYLLADKNNSLWLQGIKGQGSIGSIGYSFKSFNAEGPFEKDILISDMTGRIIYSSLSEQQLSTHLMTFNKEISKNAEESSRPIYTTVYHGGKGEGSLVLSRVIYEQNEVAGFVNIYIASAEWQQVFSTYHFDGVITDRKGNVIYSSRDSFVEGINKFTSKAQRIYYSQGSRYWLKDKFLEDYQVHLYALVYYPSNSVYMLSGLSVIILLGFCWYKLAEGMSRKMAEKKASSVNELVKEIKIIRRGEHNHRINIATGDEITDVASEINRMLDNIKKLNEKNTELLQLNNVIEMKQLTEQINPHFLYNTLETIRFLVLIEPKKAERLISELTQILRYTINNTKRDVQLLEDMEYLKDYLSIQSSRFGERFSYEIDIEPQCYSCIIPKLLLQPVIENCIKYGFRKKVDLSVTIKGRMEGQVLWLQVIDNGGGLQEAELEELKAFIVEPGLPSEHHGLRNIARRLYLKYGRDSGVSFKNNKMGGLTVTLRVSQKEMIG